MYKHKLEIFENIRKFKEKLKPKKIIYLTNILHILRLSEKKRLFSFALFTNNEKIGLVADSEEETMRWLSSIKTLRKERIEKENIKNGKEWYITVKKRGIGESHDLSSCILLRIALNSIEFATEDATILTIPSYLIKRCGYTEKVVFIELFKNKEFLHNEIWFEMLSDEDVDDVQGMISSYVFLEFYIFLFAASEVILVGLFRFKLFVERSRGRRVEEGRAKEKKGGDTL